jgi:hypothetical protein
MLYPVAVTRITFNDEHESIVFAVIGVLLVTITDAFLQREITSSGEVRS